MICNECLEENHITLAWTGSWFSTEWLIVLWRVLEALRRTSSSNELTIMFLYLFVSHQTDAWHLPTWVLLTCRESNWERKESTGMLYKKIWEIDRNNCHCQDWKSLGAEQQLCKVWGVADAYLGQVAWGAEQEWCCLDPKQNYSQVAWSVFLKTFWTENIRLLWQVGTGDQGWVFNILLGCKVSSMKHWTSYHGDYLQPCHCRNDIPVISPALTDGSLGDMLFFHSFKNPGAFSFICLRSLTIFNIQAWWSTSLGT